MVLNQTAQAPRNSLESKAFSRIEAEEHNSFLGPCLTDPQHPFSWLLTPSKHPT